MSETNTTSEQNINADNSTDSTTSNSASIDETSTPAQTETPSNTPETLPDTPVSPTDATETTPRHSTPETTLEPDNGETENTQTPTTPAAETPTEPETQTETQTETVTVTENNTPTPPATPESEGVLPRSTLAAIILGVTAIFIILVLGVNYLLSSGPRINMPGDNQTVPGSAPVITEPATEPPTETTPTDTPTTNPTNATTPATEPTSLPNVTNRSVESAKKLAFPGVWTPKQAETALEELKVTEPLAPGLFDKKKYGDYGNAVDYGWKDKRFTPECSVPNAAELRQALKLGEWDRSDCVVTSGTWYDPYAGNTIVRSAGNYVTPDTLALDRILSLREASYSGTVVLNAEQRKKFANDPINMLVTSEKAAYKKDGANVAEWQPANKETHCLYATRWVQVKSTYKLTLSGGLDEKKMLQSMLQTCGSK